LAERYEHHHPNSDHRCDQLILLNASAVQQYHVPHRYRAGIGVIVDNGIIMSENAYRNLPSGKASHSPNKS